jgi:cytochrome c556
MDKIDKILLSFQEDAKIRMKKIAEQQPYTYEKVLAQVMRLKENSKHNKTNSEERKRPRP